LMLSQSVSRALLGTAFPSPSSVHGMRRTMLSMARAYASPSSVSSDRNAETADVVEVEVEVEELLVTESDESAAWIKDDTSERAEANGANDSSGYPLLHRELSAAMLNRPERSACRDENEDEEWM
jgi:hypothetical protein